MCFEKSCFVKFKKRPILKKGNYYILFTEFSLIFPYVRSSFKVNFLKD